MEQTIQSNTGLREAPQPAILSLPLTKDSIAGPIGRNSLWLILTRVAIQVQLVLFTLLVARRLGATGFGQYAFIASVMVVANVVTTFGTDTLLIRDVARARSTSGAEVSAALWIQLALSVVFIVVIFTGTDLLPIKTPDTLSGLKLYSLALIPLAFYGVFTAILRAYERMDLYLLVNLATALIQIAAAWIALQRQTELQPLLMALIATQLCAAAFAGALCFRHIPSFSLHWAVSLHTVVQTLRMVWPLALLSVLAVIYQRMGVLLLTLQAGDAPTGWFSAAARIVEPLKFVHLAVLGALLPALSRLTSGAEATRSGDEPARAARRAFLNSFVWLLVFSAFAALFVFLAAQPLVDWLYGPGFAPSAVALQVMIWSLIPYTVSASLSLRLIVRRRERRVLVVTLISLAVALTLNLWLILAYGLIGAAMAVLGSETAQAAIFVWLGRAP